MKIKQSLGILLLALPGALVATVCDGFHVHTSTLSYPDPFLFGQAWWVYPGFLLAFLFMGHAYLFMVDRMPTVVPTLHSVSKGSARDVIESGSAFVLVYLLSGYGSFEPVILSAVFYGTFAVRWIFTYDRSWLLLLAIAMAVGGMFAEGAMAAAGLVAYRQPEVFYVPYWLGGLYVHGAFALREGMRFFVYTAGE